MSPVDLFSMYFENGKVNIYTPGVSIEKATDYVGLFVVCESHGCRQTY